MAVLSESIKKLRMSLFLDHEEFGKLIGVSKSTVCNYERGERIPRMKTIRLMLGLIKKNKLKMSADEFIGE